MNTKDNKMKIAGFTFVEFIVVIAVLGILTSVVIPKYVNNKDLLKKQTDKQTIEIFINAISIAITSEEIPDAADIITLTGSNGELDKYDTELTELVGSPKERKLLKATRVIFTIHSGGSVTYNITWDDGSTETNDQGSSTPTPFISPTPTPSPSPTPTPSPKPSSSLSPSPSLPPTPSKTIVPVTATSAVTSNRKATQVGVGQNRVWTISVEVNINLSNGTSYYHGVVTQEVTSPNQPSVGSLTETVSGETASGVNYNFKINF